MYIIALNCEKHFYFISTEDQRRKLESRGILVLKNSYDRLTNAAAAVKELNKQAIKLLSSRPRQFSVDSTKSIGINNMARQVSGVLCE